MGNTEAFRIEGFQLTTALPFRRDIFHGDEHTTGIGWIQCCDHHSYRKRRAIPMQTHNFGRYLLALLKALEAGLNVRLRFIRHEMCCCNSN